MNDLKAKITELAELMTEFELEDAKLAGDDWMVEFSRHPRINEPMVIAAPGAPVAAEAPAEPKPTPKKERKSAKPAVTGTPISSPMMGIYYSSPSPGSPPFVKEGDSVTAGQVVGLIEAMKVFNEITAAVSGKVSKIVVNSGQLVQPGEALLYIE